MPTYEFYICEKCGKMEWIKMTKFIVDMVVIGDFYEDYLDSEEYLEKMYCSCKNEKFIKIQVRMGKREFKVLNDDFVKSLENLKIKKLLIKKWIMKKIKVIEGSEKKFLKLLFGNKYKIVEKNKKIIEYGIE